MIFKEPKNQTKYKKYEKNIKTKGRHFNLNIDILENLNEIIKVMKQKEPLLKINSDVLANAIFKKYFQTLENKTDTEILTELKEMLINEL